MSVNKQSIEEYMLSQSHQKQYTPTFFLIIGCGRSGTTLLQSICTSHPDIHIGPETKFTHYFPPHMDLTSPYSYQQSYQTICEIAQREEMSLNHFDYFWQHASRDHVGLFTAWLKAGGYRHQAQIIGDASNIHTARALWWLQHMPQLKVIHLWRDPRDVAASQKRTWNTSLTRFIMRCWRAFYVHQQAQKHFPQRYYFLRYEDLVQNPKTSIQALCQAMQWPYDASMLHPHLRKNKGFASRETHKMGTLQQMTTSYIHRYRTELTQKEIMLIEEMCAPIMRAFHYQPISTLNHNTLQQSAVSRLWRKSLTYTQVIHYMMREVPHLIKEQGFLKK